MTIIQKLFHKLRLLQNKKRPSALKGLLNVSVLAYLNPLTARCLKFRQVIYCCLLVHILSFIKELHVCIVWLFS